MELEDNVSKIINLLNLLIVILTIKRIIRSLALTNYQSNINLHAGARSRLKSTSEIKFINW